ncbi:MAG: hypothetical protein ACP5IC_00050 [Minisyncoccia bacterium]
MLLFIKNFQNKPFVFKLLHSIIFILFFVSLLIVILNKQNIIIYLPIIYNHYNIFQNFNTIIYFFIIVFIFLSINFVLSNILYLNLRLLSFFIIFISMLISVILFLCTIWLNFINFI